MAIQYISDDRALTPQEFVNLFSEFRSVELDEISVQESLSQTINVTARDETGLVGCVRILTDGYLFSTITEIMVHPRHAHSDIGKRLLERAEAASPTSICFGCQPLDGELMRELGWSRGPYTFFKRKPLPTRSERKM
jgi:hypothetical protein